MKVKKIPLKKKKEVHLITPEQLKYKQSLSLEEKIDLSLNVIQDYYEYSSGNTYVSFSGGKDSTVLLHLVRSLHPEVAAVFSDTGLEYPEIRSFVKTIDNVTWIKPKYKFFDIIKKYGYPVISKEVCSKIYDIKHTNSCKLYERAMYGNDRGFGKLSNKWKFLIRSPFELNKTCCFKMKEYPFKKYQRKSKSVPFIGTLAGESRLRKIHYMKTGCNLFNGEQSRSAPLSFWTEQDIIDYLFEFKVPYSTIYDLGYKRTGCMFCCFGLHLEEHPNRFELMKQTHPKHYEYCMETLGIKDVLKWINKHGRVKIQF